MKLPTTDTGSSLRREFNKSILSFDEGEDLHVLLDTCRDNWNIVDDQMDFLVRALKEKGAAAKRIFIYQHNVIWYAQDLHYRKLFPNSFWGWEQGKLLTNFWSDVVPVLLKTGKPVFVFAGDVNAYPDLTTAYYERIGNLHLIATGMGNGQTDNIVIVCVPKLAQKETVTELVSLDSKDTGALGKLESYGLSATKL